MTPSFQQAIIQLASVIVGGLLATLGGLLGSVINHRLTANREAKARNREKLEELVSVAFEFQSWHENRATAMLFRRQDFIEENPANKLRMLTNLYFPLLGSQTVSVLKAGLDCQEWVNECWQRTVKDIQPWIDDPDRMKSYYPLAQRLIVTISDLTETARIERTK